jgi:YesN/AraC family two-component response regulator
MMMNHLTNITLSKPLQVLIVDDEESLRLLLTELLSEKECDIKTAGTAEEGLKILKSTLIDMALVDIKLPGMDGLELTQIIKEISPKTEVIIMTSHASLETSVEAMRKGAYDYLIKPFDEIEEVWFTIQRALEKRELTQNLEKRNEELESAVKRLTSLNDAGRAMSSIYNLADLLNFFIGLVVKELDVDRASLMLLNEQTGELSIAASRGLKNDVIDNVRVKLGEGICGQVALSGEPILVTDVKRTRGVTAIFEPNYRTPSSRHPSF